MEDSVVEITLIYLSVALAIIWAIINALLVSRVRLKPTPIHESSEDDTLFDSKKLDTTALIGSRIADGATAFLKAEYKVMTIFIAVFGIIILIVVDVFGHGETKFRLYATVAFIIGSFTSMLCGFIGMKAAVAANYRTAFMAM